MRISRYGELSHSQGDVVKLGLQAFAVPALPARGRVAAWVRCGSEPGEDCNNFHTRTGSSTPDPRVYLAPLPNVLDRLGSASWLEQLVQVLDVGAESRGQLSRFPAKQTGRQPPTTDSPLMICFVAVYVTTGTFCCRTTPPHYLCIRLI